MRQITDERRNYLDYKADQLKDAIGGRTGAKMIGYTVGFMVLGGSEPQTIRGISHKLNSNYSIAKRAVNGLCEVGFIDRTTQMYRGPGRPSALFLANQDLYDAVEINQRWQAAARICELALYIGTTLEGAIDFAVSAQGQALGLTGANQNCE